MEIYDSEDIKVYMFTKRILFSVMLIVSPSVVASEKAGSDSNLLIVFYVQIMPDDLVMQLHRF